LTSSGYGIASQLSVKPAEESVAEKSRCALLKCFGDDAKWRSDEQRQAVEAVIAGITPLTVVMPTAGGKSACIWLPTFIDKGKSTVVVVPLAQLAKDVVTRCMQNGVKAKHWELKEVKSIMSGPLPPVIVVVADTSNAPEFHTFAMELFATNKLARVIYDEAHYVLTHHDFRPQLLRLRQLMLPIQIVCLTATLPPCQQLMFEELMCVKGSRYIRASSNRATTAYSVRCAEGNEGVEEFAVKIIKEWKAQSLSFQKILTYACRVKQLEYMRGLVGGAVYNRGKENKAVNLENWELGKFQELFATGALSAGFNVQDVMSVVHCGEPWGITDWFQESGRAGRENEEVTSVIAITPAIIREMAEIDPNTLTLDKRVMREYILEQECRRKVITGHFDVSPQTCEQSNSVLCDLCSERRNQKDSADTRNLNGKRPLQEMEWNETTKRGRIEQRIQDQYEIVSSEAERRALLDKYIGILSRKQCTTCWLLQLPYPSHRYLHQCRETRDKLGCHYSSLGAKMRVKIPNLCCWNCKRARPWCDEFCNAVKVGKNECENLRDDVIFPVVLMAYILQLGVVKSVLGNKRIKDRDEFIAWMIEKSDKSLIACTNAQVVFEAIIRAREK
jgi:superfamily II DNA helicase RecQ